MFSGGIEMEQEPKTGYFFVLLRLENDGMTLTSVC